MTPELIAQQDEADAEVTARVANDYDPQGHLTHCEEHDNAFYTYCVACPAGTGNGLYVGPTNAFDEDLPDLPF